METENGERSSHGILIIDTRYAETAWRNLADFSRARETYELFAEAMTKGRDILVRAGIAMPRPLPVPGVRCGVPAA